MDTSEKVKLLAARYALADAEIFDEVADRLNISDQWLKEIQDELIGQTDDFLS